MSVTFDFLFYPKKPRNYKIGAVKLYLRITVDSKRSETATSLYVDPVKWGRVLRVGYFSEIVHHLMAMVGPKRDRYFFRLLYRQQFFYHQIHIYIASQMVGFIKISFFVFDNMPLPAGYYVSKRLGNRYKNKHHWMSLGLLKIYNQNHFAY